MTANTPGGQVDAGSPRQEHEVAPGRAEGLLHALAHADELAPGVRGKRFQFPFS